MPCRLIGVDLHPLLHTLRRPAVAGVIVALLALAATGASGRGGAPARVGAPERASAIAAARADVSVTRFLRRHRADHVKVATLEPGSLRVSFLHGRRSVLDAAVSDRHQVRSVAEYPERYFRAGSDLVNDGWFLALLGALFVLATAVVPLARLRNLDVLACLAFVGSVLLANQRLFSDSVLAGYLPLLYLGARCLHRGTRGPDRRPSQPLYERLSARRAERERTRVLAMVAGALALVVCTTTLVSPAVGDVGVASMSGATDLLHGVLPYGHVTRDVVHGDTYPLLAYASYLPAAAIWPVTDSFDDLQGALVIGALAMLLAALALLRSAPGREGLRRAIAWLAFAPAVLAAAAGSNDVVAAAWVAWALVLLARPARSTALVAVAAWVKVGPLPLLPLWWARVRGADVRRALAATVAVCALGGVWLVLLGGPGAIARMLHGISFQQQRESPMSIWSATGLAALRPVGQAAALGLVATLAGHAWRNRGELGGDRARVAALAGGVLITVQAVANYWSFAYLPWVFPCLVLALLASPPGRGGAAVDGPLAPARSAPSAERRQTAQPAPVG